MAAPHKAPATSMSPNATLTNQPARARVLPALALGLIRPGQAGGGGDNWDKNRSNPPRAHRNQTGECAPNPAGSAQNSSPGAGHAQHGSGRKPQRPQLPGGTGCWSAWRGGEPCGQAVAQALTPHSCRVGHRLGAQPRGHGDGEPMCCAHTPMGTGRVPQTVSTVAASRASTSIGDDRSFGESPGP